MAGSVTHKQLREKLFVAQDGKCCYCGRAVELHPTPWPKGSPTPDSFATLEHLRRKTDGGKSTPDNVALACFLCNTTRHDTNWVEFATLQRAAA